jgi:hypothetical protein
MNIGDKVKVTKIPADLPAGNVQLETLFQGCLGKTFTIAAVDEDGLYELHVGEAFGKAPEHHVIWLDDDHLKRVGA